jgi:hypothetical protein
LAYHGETAFAPAGRVKAIPGCIMPNEQNSSLSEEEFRSLVDLAAGADAGSVPAEHRRKFVRLGLLKKTGSEFRVTSAGRTRVILGR